MVSKYRVDIEAAAVAHQLAPDLVDAVTRVESSGKAYAYRYEPSFYARYMADNPKWAGANPERVSASYGLMQILYVTAFEEGFTGPPEMLFVPDVGLSWGCKHLRSLLDWASGDVERGLAAYNGGKLGNVVKPLRNQSYVNRVLAMRVNVAQAAQGQTV